MLDLWWDFICDAIILALWKGTINELEISWMINYCNTTLYDAISSVTTLEFDF